MAIYHHGDRYIHTYIHTYIHKKYKHACIHTYIKTDLGYGSIPHHGNRSRCVMVRASCMCEYVCKHYVCICTCMQMKMYGNRSRCVMVRASCMCVYVCKHYVCMYACMQINTYGDPGKCNQRLCVYVSTMYECIYVYKHVWRSRYVCHGVCVYMQLAAQF